MTLGNMPELGVHHLIGYCHSDARPTTRGRHLGQAGRITVGLRARAKSAGKPMRPRRPTRGKQ
jgi:hypothetical protein